MPKSILNANVRHILAAQVQARKAVLGVLSTTELISASNDTKLSTLSRSEAVELIGLLALLGRLRKQSVDQAVSTFSKMILKESRLLAWSAAVALAYIDEPSSVPKLIHAAKKADKGENRRAAIYALGALGDPRALDLLIHVLRNQDEKPDLRAEAAEALAACGRHSIRAVQALSAACSDSSARVRLSSASALRIVGDQRKRFNSKT